MARTVGIGVQDFGKIIRNQYFYVDKTSFIKEWWERGDEVTLLARPRRFGKTLAVSMIEHFFSIRYAKESSLFEGLSVWNEDSYRALQGSYPVISLSFANVKEQTYKGAKRKICQLLVNLYVENHFLLESGVLEEKDKDFFHRVDVDMEAGDAAMAIYQLSSYLYRYYGKKVILLLDEYDTPMQEAYINGYWEEFAGFIRSLFHASFKTNPWLERGLMTGITRVSKESVFSDLNNLEVVATTSQKYAGCFGFTEKEVFAAMDEFGLANKEEVRFWYDGFAFGDLQDIYNPWSILNYLDKKKFSPYWANTSSNSLVGKLIREGSRKTKTIMEDLLEGKALHTEIDEQIIFNQLDQKESAIWSLLLAGGYLRVERFSFDEEWGREEYDLVLTNKEVRTMFEGMFRDWFAGSSASYNEFVESLLRGDLEEMNEYMNCVTEETFSFFDTGKKPSKAPEPERFYHGFVLGLLAELRGRYILTSNRESGFGRYDVMLEPLHDTDDAIIIEFKVFRPAKEKSLEEALKAAHAQIDEKKYTAVLETKGISPERIRKYGFAFEGKKVLIG